jgi:hypothetical protein
VTKGGYIGGSSIINLGPGAVGSFGPKKSGSRKKLRKPKLRATKAERRYLLEVANAKHRALPPPVPPDSLKREIHESGSLANWIVSCPQRKLYYGSALTSLRQPKLAD